MQMNIRDNIFGLTNSVWRIEILNSSTIILLFADSIIRSEWFWDATMISWPRTRILRRRLCPILPHFFPLLMQYYVLFLESFPIKCLLFPLQQQLSTPISDQELIAVHALSSSKMPSPNSFHAIFLSTVLAYPWSAYYCTCLGFFPRNFVAGLA